MHLCAYVTNERGRQLRRPFESFLQILFLVLSVMMASHRTMSMGGVPSMLTMTASMYPDNISATGRSDLF